MARPKKTAEGNKRDRIRSNLLKSLDKKLIIGQVYLDLIEDYMAMWDIKNGLIADIQERGVSVFWQNSETQQGYKKNDSIAELNKTNAQMLKILNELGLKAEPQQRTDPDDEL